MLASDRIRPMTQATDTVDELLALRGVAMRYALRRGWSARLSREPTRAVHALDGIDLVVRPGEVVGIVGESGCGKSTLGKTIAGIHAPSAGSVHFEGNEIAALSPSAGRALRRNLQYCYQDPGASLDPRWKIGAALEEPLIVHTGMTRADRLARVHETLRAVGLPERHLDLYPHEISGGQQRRVGLARILTLSMRLFGNIYGEEQVSGSISAMVQWGVPALLMPLGLLTSVLQAFIFMLLSMFYLGEVSHHSDDHHGAEHGEAHAH